MFDFWFVFVATLKFIDKSYGLDRSLVHFLLMVSKHTSLFHLPLTLLSGNYYGTPRPVHIGPESPPITYQEHRNLLRNFRTRSKSLSNLEKAVEEGENSEEDSGLSGIIIYMHIYLFIKYHLLIH
jgi:hypothetical protein